MLKVRAQNGFKSRFPKEHLQILDTHSFIRDTFQKMFLSGLLFFSNQAQLDISVDIQYTHLSETSATYVTDFAGHVCLRTVLKYSNCSVLTVI